MKDVKDDIRGWITECLENVEEAGALSYVSLVHFDGRGVDHDLFTIKVGSARWGKPDEMTESFYRFAQRHAGGLTGSQQFQLSAVFGTGDKPLRVLPFGLQGVLSYGPIPGGGSTEPPTQIGQLQQGMRLTELLVQGAFGQTAKNADVQNRLIDQLTARLHVLEIDNRELWLALKDQILEAQKAKHADKMKELWMQRMTEFGKNIMQLAPALLNMMAGREIFPLSAADTGILDSICQHASPDDVRALQTMLLTKGEGGKELGVTLASRYEEYNKRVAKMKADDERLMAGLPPRPYEESEEDAAGRAMKALKGRAAIVTPEQSQLTQGSNGHAQVAPELARAIDNPPAVTRALGPADDLLDTMLQTVSEGEVEMLATMMAAKRPDQPDLGERIKARFTALKK